MVMKTMMGTAATLEQEDLEDHPLIQHVSIFHPHPHNAIHVGEGEVVWLHIWPLSAGPLAGKLNALEIRMQSGEKDVHKMHTSLVCTLLPHMYFFMNPLLVSPSLVGMDASFSSVKASVMLSATILHAWVPLYRIDANRINPIGRLCILILHWRLHVGSG